MPATATTFRVATGREGRSIAGTDSTILVMPSQFYIGLDEGSPLDVASFARFLRELAEKQAADIGEVLHHAEFRITRDPAVIKSWGELHDCEECRAAVRTALRYLATSDDDFLVGQLWWAAP